MSKPKEEVADVIPNNIYDNNTRTNYTKGRFFGKGGFAKCYEITDPTKGASYAGKIVSKKLLMKEAQKGKMVQEIKIHQSLNHKHVVGFHNFFEDHFNIYIVLELCRRRSMMELHKRRKTLTEPETRFYMRQILSGVTYLHQNNIIHRDLKLGNLFLNDDLHVKIGDFGLAAKIEFDGERKKTLCGTPNYIAPEILTKEGHSFEVDIWSIGCIMYTLLVGRPPFETNSLKETYSKIKKCDYRVTSQISPSAKSMIVKMLQGPPIQRPKVSQLSQHDFIVNGYCPAKLPTSSLTMAPRFDQEDKNFRKPLIDMTNGDAVVTSPFKGAAGDSIAAGSGAGHYTIKSFDPKKNFHQLKTLLVDVLKKRVIPEICEFGDECTHPASQPIVWVSKWVDYSDKYGFGYQLSDDSVGVMFNDTTKLILLPNGINVHYIDKHGEETYMVIDNYPTAHDKKMKLLSYFSRYMKEHLIKTGASVVKEKDTVSRIPYLHQWCRSTSGVLMQLNNGTVQVNFSDHSKIIMCPLMAAISYIDKDKAFNTYRFESIKKNGCSPQLYEKMHYAYDKISLLYDQEK